MATETNKPYAVVLWHGTEYADPESLGDLAHQALALGQLGYQQVGWFEYGTEPVLLGYGILGHPKLAPTQDQIDEAITNYGQGLTTEWLGVLVL